MRYPAISLKRPLVGLSLWACLLVAATPSALADGPEVQPVGTCDQPPSFYVSGHYKIAGIRITSPFDYLPSVRRLMADVLTAAGPRVGDEFSAESVSEGRSQLRERLNHTAGAANLPITVDIVTAEIVNCQQGNRSPSLEVVYNTFSTWAPFMPSSVYEDQANRAADPASATGIRKKKVEVVPQVGYNATAKLLGGGRTSVRTLVGNFDVAALGSSEILSLESSLSGEHKWDNGWIKSAEWRLGYSYQDSPTDTDRLKRARLTGQIFANSVPLGSSSTVVRFGVSIGGGHDQSKLPGNLLPSGTVSSSPIGEFKTYAGISGGTGANLFKVSYGLQLGEADTGLHVDFIKHVADAAYDRRFQPWPHKPVELNARVTGGWIQNISAIPAAERFLGGNSEQEFIAGDSWRIRAAPFIRSIPQNRLNRLAPDSPIGGENFISANITLGVTAWNRPLMPEEIGANRQFRELLGSELKSAQSTLESYWISKDEAVPSVLSLAPEAVAIVRQLRNQFDRVQDSVPENLRERFSECDFQVTLAEGFADALESDKNQSKRFTQMKSLVAKGDDGSIDKLVECLNYLSPVFGKNTVEPLSNKMQNIQNSTRDELSHLDKAMAQKKAARDMRFINQTVMTVVDEMNYIAISPIATFDLARIGPQAAAAGGGFRYGIGAGVRLTILDTIRMDAGYAVNPNPRAWEGRGAAFFSLEVASLFR